MPHLQNSPEVEGKCTEKGILSDFKMDPTNNLFHMWTFEEKFQINKGRPICFK